MKKQKSIIRHGVKTFFKSIFLLRDPVLETAKIIDTYFRTATYRFENNSGTPIVRMENERYEKGYVLFEGNPSKQLKKLPIHNVSVQKENTVGDLEAKLKVFKEIETVFTLSPNNQENTPIYEKFNFKYADLTFYGFNLMRVNNKMEFDYFFGSRN